VPTRPLGFVSLYPGGLVGQSFAFYSLMIPFSTSVSKHLSVALMSFSALCAESNSSQYRCLWSSWSL